MSTNQSIGYQGSGSFWGSDPTGQPKSSWFNNDLADAGQALYSDPNSALTSATLPDQLIAQLQEQEAYARAARGGFMAQFAQGLGNIDSALSNIPGWGVVKNVGKTLWWPIDKVASGAYWLYSEAISQPLSTALLTASEADLSGDMSKLNPFSDSSTWGKNYDMAEHISPAQAFVNYENTVEASGKGTLLSGFFGEGADRLSAADREAVKRNTDRFMYDTDFWRKKQGWTYTAGTGALDFTLSMGADPAYAAVSAVSKGVKAARSTQLTTAPAETQRRVSGVYMATDKLAKAVGSKFAKTPEAASRSTKMNKFYDWAEGKSPAEIAQHPIWGRGRRVNPERYRLAELFSKTARDEMPLIARFAGGDNNAVVDLVRKAQDNAIQLGRMQESRVLVDSAKYDSDLLQHFMTEESRGLGTPASPGVLGVSDNLISEEGSLTPLMVEPPYPRPTEPGPRQRGWDLSYGRLAEQANVYRAAAGKIIKGMDGVRPMGGAAGTASADILRAEKWKADQLDLINRQIGTLQSKEGYYASVLGTLGKGIDEYTPAESNIFGTLTSLYRQGPLATRSSEKTAEKKIARMTGANVAKVGKDEAGFVSRTIRNGFYSPSVRVVNSFGNKVPQTMIDHNAEDAFERVSEMLRGVPKLDPEARLGMINTYANAGDKVARAQELDRIHAAVIQHMAGQYNLNMAAADQITKMVKTGQVSTMNKLTGQVPNDQMFTAARTPEGVRADMVEDGETFVIAPLAKSQLSISQPLLDVKELERYMRRNSGFLNRQLAAGANVKDAVLATADSMNNIWKAATLLRPGYILRSMSDEQAASAVKFGVISMAADAGQGGYNWMLNRGQQLSAYVGKGSYVPTSGAGAGSSLAAVKIEDEVARAIGQKYPELKAERINPGKAWPLIEGRMSHEKNEIKELEDLIIREKRKKTPDQDLIAELGTRIDDHKSVIDEFSQYAGALLDETAKGTGRRLGTGTYEYKGHTIPQAFSDEWTNPIPRDQITSARAMETIFARSEAIEMNRLMKTGSWTTIAPDNPTHMDAWLRGLNLQYGQDDVFRLVAEDPSLNKAKQWLKTPDGKKHLSDLGVRGRAPEEHLQNVKYVLDSYLPPATGLQAKLAKGEEITAADLRGAIHESDFPVVHGEEFTSLTAKGRIHSGAAAIDKLIERGFNRLSTVPNDVMARQPIYLRAQEARMRQLMDQEISYRAASGMGETVDIETMNKLLKKSDALARKDISQVVYDPTRTTATEALRFVAPFLAAHGDGLSRWAGLIAEKPQFVATASKIYNAPVAAGLVTDSSGNAVDQDGYADVIDPTTGKIVDRKFVPLEERIMTLRMPDGTKGKGMKGGVPIRLSAINTILPGDPWFNPGSGPFVQVAANEIARKSPAVGDFLQWAKIIPYGPSANRTDPLIPKYLRDAWDAYTAGEKGNEAYQSAWLASYQRQMAAYHDGGPAPDMDSVTEEAKQFMYLDALTSWSMPAQNAATPLTGSPYQFFLDQYKAMQEVDPENAKANFFKRYGEDYFVFTADLSKSIGVQSSLSAHYTAEKFGDLIARDPDLAPLIVGDVYNTGKFSTSVYRKQMDEFLGGESMREKISALDAIRENQKDLGWQQYNKYVTQIDAELIRSGFHSYNQAGAEPLQEVKRALVETLAQTNEDWFEDFGASANPAKTQLRIQGMERLVQNKELMSDPMRYDLQGLGQYLAQRKILQEQLRQRGAQSLSFGEDGTPTGENFDIGMQLRTLQLYLVNNNLGFSDIFHRYLEGDDLS